MASSNDAEPVDSIPPAADSSDRLTFPIDRPNSNFTSCIKDLWQDDVFSDVTLQVDGKHFNCHKIILAANSPYFLSLLSNGMAETSKNVIELKDISSDAMENILNYIYFKDASLDVTQTIEMLKAVDMLQLDNSLKNHLMHYLIKQVADDNCLDILNLTSCIELPDLWKVANEHALLNFKTIWRSDSLLDLSKDILTEYLGDDGLLVDKEENIFYSVCRWIEADFQMRKEYAPEIFKTVRFCFIEPNILIDDIEEHPLMEQFPNLRKHIMTALRHQTTPCYQHQEHYYKCKPRLCNMTGCFLNPTDEANIIPGHISIKPGFPDWRRLSIDTINYPRYFPVGCGSTACLVGRTLYVCHISRLYKYTFSQQRGPYPPNGWQICANLPARLKQMREFTFTLCGNHIYFIGGMHDVTGVSTIIEFYNWKRDVWEAPEGFDVALLHPIRSHVAVALNSSIYIFGGLCADRKPSKFLQIYDTRKGKISMGSMMPVPQAKHTAASYNGEIYSFQHNHVLKYTLSESKWTQLGQPSPPFAIPHYYPQAVAFGDKILIFGGIINQEGKRGENILEYDINKNSYRLYSTVSPPVLIDSVLMLVNNNHLKWL